LRDSDRLHGERRPAERGAEDALPRRVAADNVFCHSFFNLSLTVQLSVDVGRPPPSFSKIQLRFRLACYQFFTIASLPSPPETIYTEPAHPAERM
jgi:hypothetical protein